MIELIHVLFIFYNKIDVNKEETIRKKEMHLESKTECNKRKMDFLKKNL